MSGHDQDDLWIKEIETIIPLRKDGKITKPVSTTRPRARRPTLSVFSPAPKGPRHQEPFDPALYEKIAAGKVSLEGKMDLHGMTEARAHEVLVSMIEAAWHQGRRRLLVITGKGREGGSPIRAALPKWLSAPNLSPYIISFDYAGQRHGGDGAFYVLLRKQS